MQLKDFVTQKNAGDPKGYSLINRGEVDQAPALEPYFCVQSEFEVHTELSADRGHVKLVLAEEGWNASLRGIVNNLQFELEPVSKLFLTAQPSSQAAGRLDGDHQIVQWSMFVSEKMHLGKKVMYFEDYILIERQGTYYTAMWPWIR